MIHYTKKQLHSMQSKSLKELVEYAGGPMHLSRMLAVPLPTVNSWIARGRISGDGVDRVQCNEALYDKFRPEELRPDISYLDPTFDLHDVEE